MAAVTAYASNYSTFGQQLQHILASSTFYWLITIAIVIFIAAVLISGFTRVATKNRLFWLLLHTISLFLISYFLLQYDLNGWLQVFIFAVGVTLLSNLYRYVFHYHNLSFKNGLIWLVINFFTLLVVNILYDALGVTDSLLQLIFAAFCLTFIGVSVHPHHKNAGLH